MTTIIRGEQGILATHTGFLSVRTAFEDSKSERPQPFLEVAGGLVPVFLKGDNPFSNAGLQSFLNKRVTCTGLWHRQTFVVSEVVEIGIEVETEVVEARESVDASEVSDVVEPLNPLGPSDVIQATKAEVINDVDSHIDMAPNVEAPSDIQASEAETTMDEDSSSEE